MPRLMALIPEDGLAIVLDGDTARWGRPPFEDWVSMAPSAAEDAIHKAGYTVVEGAPDEIWADVVRRIERFMAASTPPIDDAELGRRAAPLFHRRAQGLVGEQLWAMLVALVAWVAS